MTRQCLHTVLIVLALLLLLPAAGRADYPQTDMLVLALDGFGKSKTVAYGYFDIDYLDRNCEQPGDLLMRSFEVAAEFSLFRGVRITLSPYSRSNGKLMPRWAYYDSVSVGDGSFFPAINENNFYLQLDIGRMGTRCLSVGPVTLVAETPSWPPPLGTVYHVNDKIDFKSVDSTGKYKRLGLTVHLDTNLQANFYRRGSISVELSEEARRGNRFNLQARIHSAADTAITVGWTYYTPGNLILMQSPYKGEAHYGPFAGHDTIAAGTSKDLTLRARMREPGREQIYFMAAGKLQTFQGDKQVLSLSLPDRGLEVASVEPWRLKRVTRQTLTLRGSDFREPIAVEIEGGGVVVEQLQIKSAQVLTADVAVDDTAASTDRDVIVRSADRSYRLANAMRILRQEHSVTGVTPDTITSGRQFVLTIHGEHFPDSVYVSLGDSVALADVKRLSDTAIEVRGILPRYESEFAPIIVAGGVHSVVRTNLLHVADGNPKTLLQLLSGWYMGGIVPLAALLGFWRWKRRREDKRTSNSHMPVAPVLREPDTLVK